MTIVFCLLIFVAAFLAGGLTENCLTWALKKRLFHGGTILIRRALFAEHVLAPEDRHGLGYWLASQVPHFLWADRSGKIWSYTNKPHVVDERRQDGLFISWLKLWFYDGYVVYGDGIFGDYYRSGDPWFRWEKG